MTRKIISILLCLTMIVALATACSSGGQPAASQAPSAAPSAAPATDAGTAPTDAPQESEAPKTGFKIAYSVGYVGNAWRSQLVSSLEEAVEEYKADGTIVDFQIVSADNDSTNQINQCNALLSSGIDALLICAVSPTTLTPVVERAKELGVLLVISNDPAVYDDTYNVINDAYNYSMLINDWFMEKINGEGNVVYISGNPGNGTDMIRDQAVHDSIAANPGVKLLAEAPGKRQQTEAQTVMTTFLSTYKDINGVMCQNTTFEGVMKAYENAGVEPPVVCGDPVMSSLRLLNTLPETYDTVCVTNSPAVSVASLHFTVLLLQGYEVDESKLKPNPLDESYVNCIMVDPPYAITRDGDPNAAYLKNYPFTTALSLKDALEMYKDAEDTYIPDKAMSYDDMRTFFK